MTKVSFLICTIFIQRFLGIGGQGIIPLPRIQFYSGEGCSGNLVRDDQGDTGFPISQYRFASYNYTELWTFQPCNSANINDCDIPLIPKKGFEDCIDEDFSGYSHLHIKRKSDDFVQDKIYFYSGTRLDGNADILTNDQERKTLTFGSVFFTGNFSWTFYTEEMYEGTSHCLDADRDVKQKGFGVTLRTRLNFTMKSFRQGCHGDNMFPPEEESEEEEGRGTTKKSEGENSNSAAKFFSVFPIVLCCFLVQLFFKK